MHKVLLGLVISCISVLGYTIDFQTSLQKTIQNNKSLKAKQQNIQKAKLDLKEAQGYSFGELVFSENISRSNHPGHVFGMKSASGEVTFKDFGFGQFFQWQNSGMPGGTDAILNTKPNNLNQPESRTNFETKVTYKVPIFTGFKLSSAKKMAKLQVLAQTALYNYDEKKLTLEVLKAYNGAVAAKEFIKATKKAKEATNSFVRFAEALFEEGLVTNIDVKQAQVQDMRVDSRMIEVYNQYELAISYLRFLTNDGAISAIEGLYSLENKEKNLHILQEKGLENRNDVKWMELNTKTLQSKIDYESANQYPTLGAQIEYGYNNDQFDDFDGDHDYYLGALGLSYTLFDGAVSHAKSQKAKIAYNQAMNKFQYMKEGIRLEIEKNYLTVEAKQKVYKQKQKAQKLASEVLEQATQMYKNHLINMNELLMQQANEQQANAETILAKYEATMAKGRLKVSLGEDL